MPAPDISIDRGEQPDTVVSIREVSFSPDTVARWLTKLADRSGRHDVGVEIFTGENGALHLSLTLNGQVVARPVQAADQKPVCPSSEVQDPMVKEVECLLNQAARSLLEASYPYFVAAADYRKDPMHSLKLSRQIVAVGPAQGETVARAHNLIALVLAKLHCPEKYWQHQFKKSEKANPEFVLPYTNEGEFMITRDKNYDAGVKKIWDAILATSLLSQGLNEQNSTSSISYSDDSVPVFEAIALSNGGLDDIELDVDLADALRLRATALEPPFGRATIQDKKLAKTLYREAARLAKEAIARDRRDALAYVYLGSAQFGLAMLNDNSVELDGVLITFTTALELRGGYWDADLGAFLTLVQMAKACTKADPDCRHIVDEAKSVLGENAF